MFRLLTVLSALLPLLAAEEDALKICLTKLGCLRGTLKPGHLTDDYEAYMGIPFAQPPVGDLRLKNPVPLTEPWTDVFDATTTMQACLQKGLLMKDALVLGVEDCLYLNVYRPQKRNTDKLPVLFYIHGGGYYSGSPNILEADYLMATGEVILVNFAYRLGPFGFLSTGDESMPGNFGLKDQNMALKWVHENIAAFGGDPNLITIAGHSAGGSSVHQHVLSEASRGLFQRAIAFSGTALTPFGKQLPEPLSQARHVASLCGIVDADTLSPYDLAEQLRKLDADKLVNVVDSMHAWNRLPSFYFAPVIEQPEWENAFLTGCTTEAELSGKFTQVPFMITTVPTAGEGAVLFMSLIDDEKLQDDFNSNFDMHLSHILKLPESKASELLNELLAEYTNGVHEFNNDTLHGILTLFGDYLFQYGFTKTLQAHATHTDATKNPFYMLYFNYRGYYSYSNVILGGTKRDIGAVHLDDSIYMFYIPLLFPVGLGTDTPCAKMKQRMVELLLDFMKFGELRSTTTKIGPCTPDQFSTGGEHDVCDYLYIENSNDGFQESAVKHFEVKAKHIWQQIFNF